MCSAQQLSRSILCSPVSTPISAGSSRSPEHPFRSRFCSAVSAPISAGSTPSPQHSLRFSVCSPVSARISAGRERSPVQYLRSSVCIAVRWAERSSPFVGVACKVELPLKQLNHDAIAHLQDIINGTRKAHAQHKLVDDNDKSHLHLGIWCCEDLFSHSPEKNAARRGIYIMTCSDDIVGDSFAGQPEKTAEKRSNAVEQGCKDKVKNVVEKNILVDVWPLNDAVEAVDEDKSLPEFSPDGFFQKVLDLSIDEDAITTALPMAKTTTRWATLQRSGRRSECEERGTRDGETETSSHSRFPESLSHSRFPDFWSFL